MRRVRGAAVGLGLVLAVAGCSSFGPQDASRLTVATDVELLVVDERGDPVPGAVYELDDGEVRADPGGRIELDLVGPVGGVVTASDKLPEPLVVAPGDRSLTIALLDRVGPAGERVAVHFGGDVMLGRRYQEPGRDGTALATDAESARAVAADLAPISAAADATIVNAETVIGDLPPEAAFPGKRFLIQSPPYVVDLLDELGVDGVTLGNNHAADWLDPGIESTLAALAGAGIATAGAGLDEASARAGMLVPVGTGTLGIVSATTVDGSFVNDQLPTAADPVPADLPDGEAWQYEERELGFGAPGDPTYVAVGPRRAGDAWRTFVDLEADVTSEEAAVLWAALTAPDAFPELQDWTARRGHGGAAGYDRAEIAREIDRLRAAGADHVVVQFHGGFQFAEVKSDFLARISRAAVDDGADLVVSHHPHVLQGLEWYRGRLIAHSLGNLVFDQDFLATFPSALLRVVLDADGLVEARLLPVMLVDYRPVPVAGDAARRIIRSLDARSALPAVSGRVDGLEIAAVLTVDETEGAAGISVVDDRNTGLVGRARPETESVLPTAGTGSVTAPPPPSCLLARTDVLRPGVEVGVDLFDWGSFDDVTADGDRGRPMHWVTPSEPDDWSLAQGSSPDPHDDALRLNTDANREVRARFVARVTVADHRLRDAEGRPADGPPSYTLELEATRDRGEALIARFDVYHVDDADPTSDPESTLVRSVDVPLEIDDSDEWQHLTVPLDGVFDAAEDGRPADAAMVTFEAAPAFRGRFTLDDVRIVEWRGPPATSLPVWGEIDAIRSPGAGAVTVVSSGCSTR